jgi:hypothetical protein
MRRAVAALVVAAMAGIGLVPTAFAERGAAADQATTDRAASGDRAVSRERASGEDGGSDTTTAAQTLTWTANNSTTEYASVTTEAVAGPATIVFENSEATGNTSGMQHTLTFDTTTEGYNHDVDVDILAYPSDESGGRHTQDVVLTEGTYLFHCVIPGHGSMTGELVVTGGGGGEDTTPPEVTASIDGDTDADGDYVGAATISLDASDAGSGVDSIEYQIDDESWLPYTDPVEVTEVGDHTVSYRATDVAGNTSEPQLEQFTIVEGGDPGEDTTPPEASAMLHGETNADGAYLGSAEVMLSATDEGSGVDAIEYRLDDGAWTAYADPFTVDEVGDHTVTYRATDVAGNVSEPQQKAFTVVQGPGEDPDAPEVSATVSGNQDGSWNYVGSATVSISATDEGSGVDSIEYALDGGSWREYADPVTVNSAGEHIVTYRAADAAGNVSATGSTTFTVVPESDDPTCADPDPSPTVVIGTIGTGVRNRAADGRCTIDDLIQDEARWSDHDDFVAHARAVTAGLRQDGIVTRAERTKILDAAERSDVGR